MTNPTETTASADALLPCPFCSCEEVRRIGRPDALPIYVSCDTCKASGPYKIEVADAIAAWNTRTAANASEGSSGPTFDKWATGLDLTKNEWHWARKGWLAARQAFASSAPHAAEPTPAPVEGVTEAIPMLAAQRLAFLGLAEWQSKPHNARWWKRIDGTPIPNDLPIYIAEVFADAEMVAHEVERARQRPNDDVSAPRDTDCEAIRDKRIGVLARAEDGSAAMMTALREPDAPPNFDPGTVIATLTLDDGRTASDRVTASWAAQVLRELGGART